MYDYSPSCYSIPLNKDFVCDEILHLKLRHIGEKIIKQPSCLKLLNTNNSETI